jgi:hypothetical protein
LGRAKEKMKVIDHQDRSEHLPGVLLDSEPNAIEELVAICIVNNDWLSTITPASHVVNRVGELNSQLT